MFTSLTRTLPLVAALAAAPALAQEAAPADGMAPEMTDDLVCEPTIFPEGMTTSRLEGEASGSEAACFLISFPESRNLVVTLVEGENAPEDPAMRMHLGLSPMGETEMRVIVGQLDETAPLAPFALDLTLE